MVDTTDSNDVYQAVRECLRILGMDESNYDTASWNPLGTVVRPGDRVILKPNFLAEGHALRRSEWIQVITHGSLIRAVLDYVFLALDGRGEVYVADGPQYDSDWDLILTRTGTRDVVAYCTAQWGMPIELIDLRDYKQELRGDVIYRRGALSSDPRGGVEVNLGDSSAFNGHTGSGRYYGSDYDQAETNFHHSAGRHDYRISATAARADVFVNLPKLKTHKKVGVTLCLKNLVGINVGRNWLPHHTDGTPSEGGDQFPQRSVKAATERAVVRWLQRGALRSSAIASLYRIAKAIGKPVFGTTGQVTRHGNWSGNDTAWRMVLDINRCLVYSGGSAFPTPVRKRYFALVDGIVGGEGDGPACPDPTASGVVIAGANPVAVDCVSARLMGFDVMSVMYLRQAFIPHALPLADFRYDEVQVVSNEPSWRGPLSHMRDTFHFKPHFGWVGAIECYADSKTSEPRSAVRATANSAAKSGLQSGRPADPTP
jgi:uncharacterized protein (DUF362 family)